MFYPGPYISLFLLGGPSWPCGKAGLRGQVFGCQDCLRIHSFSVPSVPEAFGFKFSIYIRAGGT